MNTISMNPLDVNHLDVDVLGAIAEMVAIGRYRDSFRFSIWTDSGNEVIVMSKPYEEGDVIHDAFIVNVIRHYKHVDHMGEVEEYNPPIEIINIEICSDKIDALNDIGLSRIGEYAVRMYIDKISALARGTSNEDDYICATNVFNAIFGEASQ